MQIDESVTFDQIETAVTSEMDSSLASFGLVDVYQGKDIPTGQRSLTLRFKYRRDDRTLTAEEIDSAHQAVVSHLLSEFGAKQR